MINEALSNNDNEMIEMTNESVSNNGMKTSQTRYK